MVDREFEEVLQTGECHKKNNKTCRVKYHASDALHRGERACVFAIVNEKNEIISDCFSDWDLHFSRIDQELENKISNGECQSIGVSEFPWEK